MTEKEKDNTNENPIVPPRSIKDIKLEKILQHNNMTPIEKIRFIMEFWYPRHLEDMSNLSLEKQTKISNTLVNLFKDI